MSKSILFVLAAVFTFVSSAFSNQMPPDAARKLRTYVDHVLKGPHASIRNNVDFIFKLVDLLLEEDRKGDAERYLSVALRHSPEYLNYQMIHAELLSGKGNRKQAQKKAALVFKQAETDELLDRAGKILRKEPPPRFEKISELPGSDPGIVLVPIQECDTWLIMQIKDKIAAELQVPVAIRTIESDHVPYTRDGRTGAIRTMRSEIIKNIQDGRVVEGMQKLGLGKEDLNDDRNVVALVKYLQRKTDTDLEAYLRPLTGKDPQWDADQLLNMLVSSVDPWRRKNVLYLGITRADIFAGDNEFLYSRENGLGAIVSYNRFTAERNNEVQNQERLARRTLMQCLSSIGNISGIMPCADPACIRARTNSLSGPDGGKGTLCAECRDRFKAVFRQPGDSGTKDQRANSEHESSPE